MMIDIPGLDTKTGFALYGEDREIYLIVLRSFVNNTETLFKKLKEVTEDNLQEYAINVHGLKGICASIAAEELKDKAYALEQSARAGDYSAVISGNEELVKNAENLVLNIKTFLQEIDNQNPLVKLPYPDKKLLSQIGELSENFDINGIDDILNELEAYEYEENGSIVKWLREKADDLDFTAISNGIKELNL